MKMACSACPSSARSYAKNSKSNQLEVVINGDRRVVAELLVLVDRAVAGGGGHGRCRQVVVQPPADVFGVGLTAVAPPGVGFVGGLGVQAAVDVDQLQLVNHAGDPGALFG